MDQYVMASDWVRSAIADLKRALVKLEGLEWTEAIKEEIENLESIRKGLLRYSA
jgi:hypothetical protein